MQYEIYKKTNATFENKIEWHWRLVKIINNKIIAVSPEAFETREDCEKSIQLNMLADYSTPIVDVNEKIKQSFRDGFIRKNKSPDSRHTQ